MTIAFHCEYCGKKIEAPNSAGGKWGKCPACHNKLYVPNLNPDEELKLAPVDENEQAKQKHLMAETSKLTQDILREKETPDDSAGSAPMPAFDMSDKELTKNIIVYLRQVVNGDLGQAETTANSIAPYGNKALNILDSIALSEIPEPELADIPPQILSGLIRTLRSKIS